MIDLVCERLRSPRAPALRRSPVGGLVLGIDRDPQAKVTLLLFDDTGAVCAVAKVARDTGSADALKREHAALCRLESPAAGGPGRIPRPLLLDLVAGRLVLATTAIPGAPMTLGYYTPGHVADRDAVCRDFVLAGRWLADFQRHTSTRTVTLGDELFHDQLEPVLSRYRRAVGNGEDDAEACAGLEAQARALPTVRTRLGEVHGDFAIGNVLTDRGRLAGVIDWELSRPSGLPFTDVLKFAASYSSFLDRAEPPRGQVMRGHPGWTGAARRWPSPSGWTNLTGFMYGFHGEGWYPELVRDFVGHHAARLGLPPAAIPVLLATFVAEQATVLANPGYAAGYRRLFRVLHDLSHQPGPGVRTVGSRL